MSRLLKTRQMRLYLAGDTASNFGDFALFLAMAIWVKSLSGSTSAAALVMFSFAAGSGLLPFAGLLADRVNRRRLLIVANLALAAVVLVLLLVRRPADVWLVYVVMFAYGALGSVTGPAQQALLPSLVEAEQLGDANGLLQATRGLLRVFAPVAGAGLYVWLGGPAVVIIDAATFVFAALTLIAIHVTEPPRVRSDQHWLAETGAGLRFIVRHRALRQLAVACGLAMLVLGFFESIGLAVVTSVLHHAPSFLGVLGIAQAIGTVVGGSTAGTVLRRAGQVRTVIIGLAATAAASALLFVAVDAFAIAAMLLLGVVVPWIVVAAVTALQQAAPEALQGRVSAAFEFGVTVPQTVSIAVGAALIANLDYRYLVLVVIAVVLAAAAYLATRRTDPAGPTVDAPEPSTVDALSAGGR
jgi:MFS family permease